jgi:Nucleotidyl transferase
LERHESGAKALLVMAAGLGSRYGGLKQIDPVGPGDETLLDYSVFDACRAGFTRVVFVIRRDIEKPFRETVGRRYEDRMDVGYVFQEKGDLPAGFGLPKDREKPWGTAHAVLAAEKEVASPFAAANADDFYGPHSFRALSEFLDEAAAHSDLYAVVGFRLGVTLSDHGEVARAICEVSPDGFLRHVFEVLGLERAEGSARAPDGKGGFRYFPADTPVSLNLWGFTPSVFPKLRRVFAEFLAARGTDPRAEFYLPDAVGALIAAGEARVRVLPTPDPWFGLTHRADLPEVKARLRALHDAGAYPERLFAA